VRRLRLLLVPLLALGLAAAIIAVAGSADGRSFRTPDAGAACRLSGTTLVCSSLGSEGSVALRPHARARIVKRLPWWDARTPVLRRWSRDGISCRLSGRAILCHGGATTIRVDADGFALTS
jgi:hypothetical protein